jgi:hypothetical protein
MDWDTSNMLMSWTLYKSKLVTMMAMAWSLVVIRRSSMAGLHARANCFVSAQATALNGTLRLVKSPNTASAYCLELNAFRSVDSDGLMSTNESRDSLEADVRELIDLTLSCNS